MDMLPTLCAAMKRAGGDALVLRTGESPHVLTGGGRQNVARAVLSANALEALVTQIFSEADGRRCASPGTSSKRSRCPAGSCSAPAPSARPTA